jgi:hypothetical protein
MCFESSTKTLYGDTLRRNVTRGMPAQGLAQRRWWRDGWYDAPTGASPEWRWWWHQVRRATADRRWPVVWCGGGRQARPKGAGYRGGADGRQWVGFLNRRSVIGHMSCFLLIETRWVYYLWFIFWQRFVSLSPLPNWNWSIEFTPSSQVILSGPSTLTSTTIKKIISILIILSTTQSHLYFFSSLARAQCHRCSTHRRYSLSSLSHTCHPSTQRHAQWWTS